MVKKYQTIYQRESKDRTWKQIDRKKGERLNAPSPFDGRYIIKIASILPVPCFD